MGFNRQPSPTIIAAAKGAPVELLITSADIGRIEREADPFLIDGACEFNGGAAHQIIAGCRDIVCAYCARVFWR